MAVDDRGQAGGGGVQVQGEEFVEDVEVDAPHFHHPGLGEARGPVAPVGVAPDRVHRGEALKLAQKARVADVPGVDDEFHALQGLDGFGPQQAVGIGDDADEMFSHKSRGGQVPG